MSDIICSICGQRKAKYEGKRCRECVLSIKNAKKREKYANRSEKEIENDRIKNQEYYKNNKDKMLSYQNQYYIENKNDRLDYQNKYYQDNAVERIAYQKQYDIDHSDAIKEYAKSYDHNRRKTDPSYKLHRNISSIIYKDLKKMGSSKNNHSCWNYITWKPKDFWTDFEVKRALPENLTPDGRVWMTRENHGIYDPTKWDDNDPSTWTWQLDHIIPRSDLPYTSMEDENFKKCWALDNLRPLSAKQNLLDGVRRVRHKKNGEDGGLNKQLDIYNRER
jgi:hypothetical protein